ncbi:DNA mismatch repair endonuclease MutL [Harryflintia acetispora]|uniref:DNA mismatch repair protein MutL n=1 Tax=Harryflintia acetispora TaxID=1849041 RepID=A0A9X8ULN9_9FIRM|nr:DNA mismatch repair endonuclease MutL [Harryflintia acetispora]TCL45499.1 DNA mismatch repair protein MutL [Harryflintia acetispora]
MGKINVLSREMAELIAAGEVIDRPASVIKELVENAIDAHSTQITVEIQRGGITYMRVSDNGGGIGADEIDKAFLRHATSKLREPDDLQNILTMGFRGEALASIAAMCRVEVLSRTPESDTGVRYCIEGGQETEKKEAGCPVGTTIVVRDIFYNTPARMKFLKKDVTESNAVASVIDKLAVVHPGVSWKLIRDGKITLHTPGNGKLADALYAVYGRQFFATLVPVDSESRGVRVSGFVSRPSEGRGNRTMQSFYINGRYVRSKTCMAALEEAYRHSIMKGKFPACVLDVSLPPSTFDINVHPAKLEVRFENEKLIFDAVYYAVRAALQRLDLQGVAAPESLTGKREEPQITPTPAPGEAQSAPARSVPAPGRARKEPVLVGADPLVSPKKASATPGREALPVRDEAPREAEIYVPRLRPFGSKAQSMAQSGPTQVVPAQSAHAQSAPAKMAELFSSGTEADDAALELHAPTQEETAQLFSHYASKQAQREEPAPKKEKERETVQSTLPGEEAGRGRYSGARLIGELLRTYILLECDEQLILIDKHAAHERLNYERLRAAGGKERQLLLTPVPVTLPKEEYALILQSLPLLEELGFGVEDFGEGSVLVREVPLLLDASRAGESVEQIASQLSAGSGRLSVQAVEDIYHSIACKASIRANDVSDPRELEALVRLLDEHEEVRFCPHGRPIAAVLTRAQIERMFGRA